MKSGHGNRFLPLIAAVAVLLGGVSSADAELLEFTLDEAQTTLTLTYAELPDIGAALDPQEAGVSDVSTLFGSQIVDLDDFQNPTTIEFISGNMAMAANGSWLPDFGGGTLGDPGNPQPGSYAVQLVEPIIDISLYSVFRDLTLQLAMWDEDPDNPPEPDPIPVIGGNFAWDVPNAQVLVDVTGGTWDWNVVSSLVEGGADFDSQLIDDTENLNLPDTPGTYSVVGNTATLTIPFHSRLGERPDGSPSSLLAVFEGLLVMTANIGPSGPNADFDMNQIVDGDDFLIWQSGFGGPGAHAEGDANADGIVDGDDFLIWQAQFGGPPPGSGSGAVPEPATAGLAILAAMAFGVAAMRKRLG